MTTGEGRTPARIRLAVIAACAVATVAVGVFLWMRSRPPVQPTDPNIAEKAKPAAGDLDPRAWDKLLEASGYKNVHPSVKYVNDSTCAQCHEEIATAYARHPMGRSLAPTPNAESIEEFTAAANHPLNLERLLYEVRRDDGRQFHSEKRITSTGETALAIELEAAYAVGSGRTGRSYLIDRDGHLFMSPLTWFTEHGWDLSPGYEVNNSHFNRPVLPECLFCHANAALHVDGTLNKYEPQIFAGHAIGCQRCHGPGELHVAAHQDETADKKHDTTIVNPAKLEPSLRESVCQQCHLAGLVRVATRGRRWEDFRPGLPWSAVVSVFLAGKKNEQEQDGASAKEPDSFVGHVEQMHQSVCYSASQGKLGCISCHDPHRLPEASAKVQFYRERCMQCHGETDCELSPAARREKQADDSCFACHMPRLATEIRHAATTDHRIPRTPDAARRQSLPPPQPPWSPLVAFESLVVGSKQNSAKASPPPAVQAKRDDSKVASADGAFADPDEERNFAMALVMGADRHPGIVDAGLLTPANSMLARAIARDPSDLAARQALALVLAKSRRMPQALAQLDQVLAREPNRESALELAASMLSSERRWSSAADLWRRVRDVNPSIARYWTELALCQSRLANWDACQATCEEAIERFPDSFGARQMLIECHLVAGRASEAEQEYERLIALNPPKPDSIRQWWQEHPRRRQPTGDAE